MYIFVHLLSNSCHTKLHRYITQHVLRYTTPTGIKMAWALNWGGCLFEDIWYPRQHIVANYYSQAIRIKQITHTHHQSTWCPWPHTLEWSITYKIPSSYPKLTSKTAYSKNLHRTRGNTVWVHSNSCSHFSINRFVYYGAIRVPMPAPCRCK